MLIRASGLASGDVTVKIDQALLHVLTEAGRVDDALEVGHRLLDGLSNANPARAEVHTLLARAAVAAGRWSLARTQIASARSAGAVPTPPLDALAAQVQLGVGSPAEAVGLAERALASAGPAEHAVQWSVGGAGPGGPAA